MNEEHPFKSTHDWKRGESIVDSPITSLVEETLIGSYFPLETEKLS